MSGLDLSLAYLIQQNISKFSQTIMRDAVRYLAAKAKSSNMTCEICSSLQSSNQALQ